MTLIVETGVGVPAAESYCSVDYVDTYWAARTNNALSATWAALTTAKKEGSIREATDYLDATYGQLYKGIRKGLVQGLLFPRSNAKDEAGYPLPALPRELQAAVAELAVRASSAALVPDVDLAAIVKSETKTVGPLTKSITYADPGAAGTLTQKIYTVVDGLLAPILTNSMSASGGGPWSWA